MSNKGCWQSANFWRSSPWKEFSIISVFTHLFVCQQMAKPHRRKTANIPTYMWTRPKQTGHTQWYTHKSINIPEEHCADFSLYIVLLHMFYSVHLKIKWHTTYSNQCSEACWSVPVWAKTNTQDSIFLGLPKIPTKQIDSNVTIFSSLTRS